MYPLCWFDFNSCFGVTAIGTFPWTSWISLFLFLAHPAPQWARMHELRGHQLYRLLAKLNLPLLQQDHNTRLWTTCFTSPLHNTVYINSISCEWINMSLWSGIFIFNNIIILLYDFLTYENYRIQDPVFCPFFAHEDLWSWVHFHPQHRITSKRNWI